MGEFFLDAVNEVDQIFSGHMKESFFQEITDDSSTVSAGSLITATSGLLFGPIGAIVAGTAVAGIAAAKQAKSPRVNRVSLSTEEREKLLLESLKRLTHTWDEHLDPEDRLTAYVSMMNGCALHGISKEHCEHLIESSRIHQNKDFLSDMMEFVYSQLEQDTSSAEIIETSMFISKYRGKNQHHVLSVYRFTAAIAKFLPDETDTSAYNKAYDCFFRMPKAYQDFVLLKNNHASFNPAMYQFLLPQLCESSFRVTPTKNHGNTTILERQTFLHLKELVSFKESQYMSLSEKLQAMFESQHYAYKAAEDAYAAKSILRDFAHTYGNMKTTQLDKIAEELFKVSKAHDIPELRRLAQITLLEAKFKKDLRTGIELMHLRCREDIAQISKRLTDSVVKDHTASDLNSENICDIANDALMMTLYRIFYDGSDRKADIARKRLKQQCENFGALRHEFEESVIIDGISCVEWVIDSSLPVTVVFSVDPVWESLLLYKGSFASVLLVDLLAEMLFNAFKYADYNQPIEIHLGETEDYLSLTTENLCSPDVDNYVKGTGLNSRNQTLSMINSCQSSVSVEIDSQNHHRATLFLRKDFFFEG